MDSCWRIATPPSFWRFLYVALLPLPPPPLHLDSKHECSASMIKARPSPDQSRIRQANKNWLDCNYSAKNTDEVCASTINFILFWVVLMFYQIFLLPQLERCAIITYKHGIYKLPHELPNDVRLTTLRNSDISRKCLNFI